MTARDPQRRDRLLDATVTSILRHGSRRTSVEEIARAAGVSKGAVYLEFPNRRALFDAAIRREYQAYMLEVADRVDADPIGGRISRIYRHSVAALLDRPLLRAIYEDDEQIVAGILRGPERYRPRILMGEQFLRRLTEAGLLRTDIEPATMSHLLTVLGLGPLLAEPVLRDESSPSLEATIGLLADLVVTGLEPAEPGDPAAGVAAFRELVNHIHPLLDDAAPYG